MTIPSDDLIHDALPAARPNAALLRYVGLADALEAPPPPPLPHADDGIAGSDFP